MARFVLGSLIFVCQLYLTFSCSASIAASDVHIFRSAERSEHGPRCKLACSTAGAKNIFGVNWGQYFINDPPSAKLVVQGLKSYGFNAVKVYGVLSDDVISALSHTDIQVTIAVDGALLYELAGGNTSSVQASNFSSVNDAGKAASTKWLMDHVVAPVRRGVRIRQVVVGNEPDWLNGHDHILIQVMENLNAALAVVKLTNTVSLIIPLRFNVMGFVVPPSNGSFVNITEIPMLLRLLNASSSPFAINLYTYIPDDSEPFDPTSYLNYLTFQTPSDEGLIDTKSKVMYQNQFELEYDSVIQAVRTAGYPNMKVIVTETGWPTNGTTYATLPLATNFTQGLASYLKSADGTPLCPHCPLEVYIFELYDEPDKDVAQGMSETFYGISMYEGGKLVPKFPLGTNCNIVPPSPHPVANGGASTIGRSLFGILGIRELLQLLVMVVLLWPSLG